MELIFPPLIFSLSLSTVYDDETAFIPKNTSLVVKRVAATAHGPGLLARLQANTPLSKAHMYSIVPLYLALGSPQIAVGWHRNSTTVAVVAAKSPLVVVRISEAMNITSPHCSIWEVVGGGPIKTSFSSSSSLSGPLPFSFSLPLSSFCIGVLYCGMENPEGL